jgi:hypothetical protein
LAHHATFHVERAQASPLAEGMGGTHVEEPPVTASGQSKPGELGAVDRPIFAESAGHGAVDVATGRRRENGRVIPFEEPRKVDRALRIDRRKRSGVRSVLDVGTGLILE